MRNILKYLILKSYIKLFCKQIISNDNNCDAIFYSRSFSLLSQDKNVIIKLFFRLGISFDLLVIV